MLSVKVGKPCGALCAQAANTVIDAIPPLTAAEQWVKCHHAQLNAIWTRIRARQQPNPSHYLYHELECARRHA